MDKIVVPELTDAPPHVPAGRIMDIDVYAPPGGEVDIHAAWKTLHQPGVPDVIWTPRNGGHWIVTRAAAMAEVYQDYHRFSSRIGNVPKALGEEMNFIPASLDPPKHRSFRMLLNGSFAPKIIGQSRERVREIAVELIEAVREQGGCDFQAAYANHLPVRVFMEMMDLPAEDAPMIKFWSDQITRLEGHMTIGEAVDKFFEYLEPVIDERLGSDRTDIVTRLINSPVDGRPMTKEEALPLVSQVLQGGIETVINFLGYAILFLARNPEHRRMLCENPAKIPAAMDELFRRFGIVINTREIITDTELAGAPLKAGEVITMPNMLAGLDDREITCPMDVDFNRTNKANLAFGAGSHRCPGASLARIEVQVTIEEWLKRIPEFAVAPDAAPRYQSGVTPCVSEIPLVWDIATTRKIAMETNG